MGDFNYRNVHRINTTEDHESDNFINIIQDNFLKQIVSEPTKTKLGQQYGNRGKIRQQ